MFLIIKKENEPLIVIRDDVLITGVYDIKYTYTINNYNTTFKYNSTSNLGGPGKIEVGKEETIEFDTTSRNINVKGKVPNLNISTNGRTFSNASGVNIKALNDDVYINIVSTAKTKATHTTKGHPNFNNGFNESFNR